MSTPGGASSRSEGGSNSGGPQLMAKRTASPWSSHRSGGQVRAMKEKREAAQNDAQSLRSGGGGGGSLRPMRVVSDIPLPNYATVPRKKMADNASIMQAQQTWEGQNQKAVSGPSSTSGSTKTGPTRHSTGSLPSAPTPVPLPKTAESATSLRMLSQKRQAQDDSGTNSPAPASPAAGEPSAEQSTARPPVRIKVITRESSGRQNSSQSSRSPNETVTSTDSAVKTRQAPQVKAGVKRARVIISDSSSTDSDMSTDSDDVAQGRDKTFYMSDVLLRTVDHRLYIDFRDTNGTRQSLTGCAFPTSYEPHVDAVRRFVCPVRDCRRVLGNVERLAGHMRAGHCKTAFNDNLDGTLSKVGKFENPGGTAPPVVVSQNPLSPDATPPAEPMEPDWVRRENLLRHPGPRTVLVLDDDSRLENVVNFLEFAESDSPLSHLMAFLSPRQQIPQRADVKMLSQLPRLRDLPTSWLEEHAATAIKPLNFVCALAYMTGEEVAAHKGACKRDYGWAGRLSEVCVRPPEDTFSTKLTCVGCRYASTIQKTSNTCHWTGKRSISEIRAEHDAARRAMDQQEMDRELEQARRDRAQREQAQDQPITQPQLEATPSVQIQPLSFGEDLDMEVWEVAPGRITEKESGDNIGFSGPFLRTNEPVLVAENTGCNIICINPGGSKAWPADSEKLRVFFVASGKVKVKMNDTVAEYGQDSAIVISPGQECKMENRRYVEVKLYSVTQGEFGLRS